MSTILGGLRAAIEGLLSLFDWLGPFWGLTCLSVVVGLAILYLVSWTTPQRAVARSRSNMAAAIYEIRLFLDSPKRVIFGLGKLLGSSFVYVGSMLPALVVMSIPLWLMYLHLEPRHALLPRTADEPLVVELGYSADADAETFRYSGTALSIEHPPVVSTDERKIYLRVVPKQPGNSTLTVDTGSAQVDKAIASNPTIRPQPTRASGMALLDSVGTEPHLDTGSGLTSISVPHDRRHQSWLGIAIPWWVYSLTIVTLSALGLKNRLGVVL